MKAYPAPLSVMVRPNASSVFVTSTSLVSPLTWAKMKSSSPICPPSSFCISTLWELRVQNKIWRKEIDKKKGKCFHYYLQTPITCIHMQKQNNGTIIQYSNNIWPKTLDYISRSLTHTQKKLNIMSFANILFVFGYDTVLLFIAHLFTMHCSINKLKTTFVYIFSSIILTVLVPKWTQKASWLYNRQVCYLEGSWVTINTRDSLMAR